MKARWQILRVMCPHVIGIVIGMVLLAACSLPGLPRSQPTLAIPIDLPLQTQGQLRDFDLIVKSVHDQYIDPKAVGADWQTAASVYRSRCLQA